MPDSLAGVVLAAGAGTRLQPLTGLRPKALVPVNHTPLVDLAVARVAAVTADVAVNVHHGRQALEEHLAGRVHLSIESGEARGTAGALGVLRDWIAGRPVLVTNADAWLESPRLDALADGWDGERIRLLVVEDAARADFDGRWRYAGACLMPWSDVRGLPAEPSGLYERVWREALDAGRVELVAHRGRFADCGTPREYLRANLWASGGESVIGAGSVVEGEVVRSVVWPGSVVRRSERLVAAIRVGELLTVLVRGSPPV